MSPFEFSSLSSAVRWSVTFTTFALVILCARSLGRGRSRLAGPLVPLVAAFMVAAAFAHVPPLTVRVPPLFPFGLALGLGAAAVSLLRPGARRAFDALSDGDVRLMLGFRAIYGALLFGMAGVGLIAPAFALTAGLGDLAVGWLALVVPHPLDATGPRSWRLLVHGIGLLDLMQVVVLAVTVVRPWSAQHGDVTTTMTLPWVAVPLMMALNLHGFRQACTARERESRSHGSELAGRVRGALPGA